jgi:hypothetical protein
MGIAVDGSRLDRSQATTYHHRRVVSTSTARRLTPLVRDSVSGSFNFSSDPGARAENSMALHDGIERQVRKILTEKCK